MSGRIQAAADQRLGFCGGGEDGRTHGSIGCRFVEMMNGTKKERNRERNSK